MQQDLPYVRIPYQTVHNFFMLTPRHLKTDAGRTPSRLPDALQKAKRVPISRFHIAEIQRAITTLQGIEDATWIEQFVMT
jgi:hypothetical protein